MLILLTVVGIAALTAGGVGAAYVVHYANEAPPLDQLKAIVPGGNSEVFASDGTPLGYIQSDVLRSPIAYKNIPGNLKNATVAIEDQRYWQHGGVDVQGIIRSAVKDALAGEPLQGGSTIAMQLVRNIYLPASERTEDTLRRKIIEAVEADRLEGKYSKQYILSKYLNSVPYGTVGGQNAIGVAAAARVFFNTTVAQLTLEQCALLAGLPQAPSEYNPFLYPAAATERRNEVLAKMAQLHYITQAQAQAAIASPLDVHHSTYYEQHRESYFFDYVTQQLIDTYGVNTVEQGGLRVYTTINLHYQDLARQAIATELGEPGDPAAAVVTEDPRNGHILAMAQSAGTSQYNLAADAQRQPGSTMKAIDLADALEHGIDPDTTYFLSHTLEPGWLPGYPTYEVKTFEGTSLNKSISLTQATLASDNTVYAQLAADLGEQSITQMAYRLGVVTHLYSNPAEALGGLKYGVTPLEMANVYATLADGGYRNRQTGILKVVFPGGRVDNHWGVPHRVKVISDAITAEETKILEENVQSGTAVRSAIACPTAAKTGTTSNLYDAWLDGYTPDYSTVVWMGYPNEEISMTDVHGEPQQGGAIPAQIWHDYMSSVVGDNCVPFPAPTESIQYSPFYGKYQDGTGSPSTSNPLNSPAPAPLPTPAPTTPKPSHHKSGSGGSGHGGGNGGGGGNSGNSGGGGGGNTGTGTSGGGGGGNTGTGGGGNTGTGTGGGGGNTGTGTGGGGNTGTRTGGGGNTGTGTGGGGGGGGTGGAGAPVGGNVAPAG